MVNGITTNVFGIHRRGKFHQNNIISIVELHSPVIAVRYKNGMCVKNSIGHGALQCYDALNAASN